MVLVIPMGKQDGKSRAQANFMGLYSTQAHKTLCFAGPYLDFMSAISCLESLNNF